MIFLYECLYICLYSQLGISFIKYFFVQESIYVVKTITRRQNYINIIKIIQMYDFCHFFEKQIKS